MIGRNDKAGPQGDGVNVEVCFTQNTTDRHAVAYNIAPGKGELKDDIHVTDAYIAKTIDASGSNPAMHQGGAAIVQPIAFGFDAYNQTIQGEVNQPLRVSSAPGQVDAVGGVVQGMAVRRLTPVECERLQGFPDNYTDIKSKNKPTPDGPRYKALGNSMAVPVMAWIGQRIQKVEDIIK
jgi:site-specific DNA-cytosine methylase